jgi:conjugative relaxase-like TrwC/TraI family protein
MLSFKIINNAAQCAHYFEDGDLDDYYTKEARGLWAGKGAEELGLAGDVSTGAFKNLLSGKTADGTKELRKYVPTLNKQRCGIDFTYSAPKSVSIQALVSGDMRVLEAHDRAVAKATTEMEKMALALKSKGGIRSRQKTGSMVFAQFRHELSREQDPQLHTHVVAMNLTRREDGAWVALTNDQILKNVMLLGAIYRGELANQLESMGYELRGTRDGFELANVSEKAIIAFSKRGKEIENELANRGKDRSTASAKEKQDITMDTRKPKSAHDREALRETWEQTLIDAGVGEKTFNPPESNQTNDIDLNAKKTELASRAVEFAIAHLSERQGVFTHGELYHSAVKVALSAYEEVGDEITKSIKNQTLIQEITLYQSAKTLRKETVGSDNAVDAFKHTLEKQKLSRQSWIEISRDAANLTYTEAADSVDNAITSGRLVESEIRYTTSNARATEKNVLEMERNSRACVTAVMEANLVQAYLDKTNLNDGQKEAATAILTSQNRVIGIQGYAGTGKSHMFKSVVDVLKESATGASNEGFTVIGLAPYASQNKALALLGMESQTLASFLASSKDQERLNEKTIILLDEASVVPAAQMLQILTKVEERKARIVLVGDRRQTQAVESGKPFEQLQDSGMQLANITKIVRQKDDVLRKAVEHAAADKTGESVKTLAGHIREIPNDNQRHQLMAKDYCALTSEDRNKTLVVAGTNIARKGLNAEIRKGLQIEEGRGVDTFENYDMTRAEHKLASCYKEGLIVMAEENRKLEGALKKGSYYEIEKINALTNELTLKETITGVTTIVNPSTAGNLSVYEQNRIELSANDWVRVTRNLKLQDLANGERYQIKSVGKNSITLSDGSVLSTKERLHLQYGYVTTVHSAQGLTEDRVLIDANTKSLTSNKSVFYVAISRSRHDLTIYTDDKKLIAETMSRDPKKFAALDLRTHENEAGIVATVIKERHQRREQRKAHQQATTKVVTPIKTVDKKKLSKKANTARI